MEDGGTRTEEISDSAIIEKQKIENRGKVNSGSTKARGKSEKKPGFDGYKL